MRMLRRFPLIGFFTLAYLLSWSVFGIGFLNADPAQELQGMRTYILIGSFGPTMAALIMLSISSEPRKALKEWALSLVRVKVHPLVYFLALLLPPVVAAIVMYIFGITPRQEHPTFLVYVTLIAMAPVNGMSTVLVGAGPLGEEPGWRGYALPRLLERMGDVKQSFVLGVIWAAWHLPVMIALPEWRSDVELSGFIPTYLVGVISVTYIITKIWRWSHGSVFLAIWFHGIVNYIASYAFAEEIWDVGNFSSLQLDVLQSVVFVVTALIVAIVGRSGFARSRTFPA